MNKIAKSHALPIQLFKKDGWKMFPKSTTDLPFHSFHLSVKSCGGETFFELIHFTKDGWTVIYSTYDKDQPIPERLFIFRGTLTTESDYNTVMRVCEIINSN